MSPWHFLTFILLLISPPLSQPQDQITITGYEKNTEAAREAILKIVGELEQMVSEDVQLDHRVHARIIGARGKAIRKIMDEFKVTQVLPARRGSPYPRFPGQQLATSWPPGEPGQVAHCSVCVMLPRWTSASHRVVPQTPIASP